MDRDPDTPPPPSPPAPPDLRIVQANERTLLAWVRTGLGIMAFGFVIARLGVLLESLHPGEHAGDGSVAVGVVTVLLGTATLVLGAVRYLRVHRAIVADEAYLPGTSAGLLLAMTLALGGLALAAFLATR